MSRPDLTGALGYALARLERELPSWLVYHSLGHTRDEVVPAAEALAARAGVSGTSLLLLRTAAYYHDLGFVVQRHNHEAAGAQIARAILPRFDYGQGHIRAIVGMIMATRLPQRPSNPLEELLADADLDLLGCETFLARNADLRRELDSAGSPYSDEDWLTGQIRFIGGHRYWSAAARTLRDEGKERNQAALGGMLVRATG
jgi:uncharacterized protein